MIYRLNVRETKTKTDRVGDGCTCSDLGGYFAHADVSDGSNRTGNGSNRTGVGDGSNLAGVGDGSNGTGTGIGDGSNRTGVGDGSNHTGVSDGSNRENDVVLS